jgi:hypothetical protein
MSDPIAVLVAERDDALRDGLIDQCTTYAAYRLVDRARAMVDQGSSGQPRRTRRTP